MSISRDYAVTDLLTVVRAGSAWSFNAAGVLTEAAANTLRQDYDPATLTYRGVLVEVAATNEATNPRYGGAILGSPGTLPTGASWTSIPAGIACSVVGVGVEDGIPYLDVRIAGVRTAGSSWVLWFNGTTTIPAAIGEVWVNAAYVRLMAGSLKNLSVSIYLHERTAVGDAVASSGTAIAPSADALRMQRVSHARTLTGATTAYIAPNLAFVAVLNQPVDATLRIGAHAAFRNPIVFSPSLPPVGAPGASTRAADDLTMSPIGSWFSADQGTIVIDFMPGQSAPPDERGIIAVDDGTASNMFDVRMVGGGLTVRLEAASGGVTQVAGLDAGAATLLARNTLRLSYGPAGYLVSLNGAAPVSAGLGTAPAGLSRVRLGNRAGASPFALNGWLGPRVQHYPVQYTDTPASDGFTIRNR